MKNVVLNEEEKKVDKEVLVCMENICRYYKKNFRKIKEFLSQN